MEAVRLVKSSQSIAEAARAALATSPLRAETANAVDKESFFSRFNVRIKIRFSFPHYSIVGIFVSLILAQRGILVRTRGSSL
jgi:hypothetical protein